MVKKETSRNNLNTNQTRSVVEITFSTFTGKCKVLTNPRGEHTCSQEQRAVKVSPNTPHRRGFTFECIYIAWKMLLSPLPQTLFLKERKWSVTKKLQVVSMYFGLLLATTTPQALTPGSVKQRQTLQHVLLLAFSRLG